ncbi:hypothetical protein ENKNEFLB_03414 [Nocardioides aquaticus]|uniref:DUF350 domain-containing protein n=1 Tax=Nocardioides aquaticus TaxID=160826 RepID=A0ABX8EKX5_9ACTN|nr:DUF350 domain-containing protein [Nocardioides aquaticus]QVT81011.1 hypothetical protein ENKNEFLB_03414 [Nocardioides aquaticus]
MTFLDLFVALYHAVVYAVIAGAMLVVSYYVLDLVTPGHLGSHLRGVDETGTESVHAQSRSAGLVTSAWLVSNALVLFTAIWTNGETDLGWALLWTVSFGALGILLNTVMFFAIEAITPGNLRKIVCEPGPVRPLAYVAAATAVSVAAIVSASIA